MDVVENSRNSDLQDSGLVTILTELSELCVITELNLKYKYLQVADTFRTID